MKATSIVIGALVGLMSVTDAIKVKEIDPETLAKRAAALPKKGENTTVYLREHFNEDAWKDRWIVSDAKNESGEKTYPGEWYVEGPQDPKTGLLGDRGLVMKSFGERHAISADLEKPFEFGKGDHLILQYEIRFQEGLECTGSYMKLLNANRKDKDLTQFDGTTPYSIMFGPDVCGSTNKLHFIIKTKNPITGEEVEHHMTKSPKIARRETETQMVGFAIFSDGNFNVHIDRQIVRGGSLTAEKEFDPPLMPARMIPDPKDVKPDSWDDREYIDDPNAEKPTDWNEDSSGPWAPPQVRNPQFKGIFTPKMIDNPGFHEQDVFTTMQPIDAVGFELLSLSRNVMFDNVLITNDKDFAINWAKHAFEAKIKKEGKRSKVESETTSEKIKYVREKLPSWEQIFEHIMSFIRTVQNPDSYVRLWNAAQKDEGVALMLFLACCWPFLFLYAMCTRGRKDKTD
eukprot:Clim_evm29s150 gene=Clim_evmTU29s150